MTAWPARLSLWMFARRYHDDRCQNRLAAASASPWVASRPSLDACHGAADGVLGIVGDEVRAVERLADRPDRLRAVAQRLAPDAVAATAGVDGEDRHVLAELAEAGDQPPAGERDVVRVGGDEDVGHGAPSIAAGPSCSGAGSAHAREHSRRSWTSSGAARATRRQEAGTKKQVRDAVERESRCCPERPGSTRATSRRTAARRRSRPRARSTTSERRIPQIASGASDGLRMTNTAGQPRRVPAAKAAVRPDDRVAVHDDLDRSRGRDHGREERPGPRCRPVPHNDDRDDGQRDRPPEELRDAEDEGDRQVQDRRRIRGSLRPGSRTVPPAASRDTGCRHRAIVGCVPGTGGSRPQAPRVASAG